MSCSIQNCSRRYLPEKKYHFYGLPKDEEIRKLWIEKGQIDLEKPKKTCRLSKKHLLNILDKKALLKMISFR